MAMSESLPRHQVSVSPWTSGTGSNPSRAVAGPEAPSVRSRALGNVGFENARAALVRGGRGQGDAAPAFLEGRGPVDLRSGYPVLEPYVPMPSNVPVGNTQPVRFNEVPGPAAQAFWRPRGQRHSDAGPHAWFLSWEG